MEVHYKLQFDFLASASKTPYHRERKVSENKLSPNLLAQCMDHSIFSLRLHSLVTLYPQHIQTRLKIETDHWNRLVRSRDIGTRVGNVLLVKSQRLRKPRGKNHTAVHPATEQLVLILKQDRFSSRRWNTCDRALFASYPFIFTGISTKY